MPIPIDSFTPEIVTVDREFYSRLDERRRREYAGTLSLHIGRGGQKFVAQQFGISRKTVRRGERELLSGQPFPDRIRLPGGGAKKSEERIPGLVEDLVDMVEKNCCGSPMEERVHTTASLRSMCGELNEKYRNQAEEQGTEPETVSATTIRRILVENQYTLQKNRKMLQVGQEHPDRDEQFGHISELIDLNMAAGNPVISIDTKKKEILGNFFNGGSQWAKSGHPTMVNDHDFQPKDGDRVVPHGICCLNNNSAWVTLGTSHDTSEFAVDNIMWWWRDEGRARFPNANGMLILCDCGGSNGYRSYTWYAQVQHLSDFIDLPVTIAHYPPGTSKYNKIEHRLWPHITRCWKGQPLTSLEKMKGLIGATTTSKGLTVTCKVNPFTYETGQSVSKEEREALRMTREEHIGDLNYSFAPRPVSQAGSA